MKLNEIYELENQLWESIQYQNKEHFSLFVDDCAVLVYQGFLTSKDFFQESITEMDCSHFTITDFEAIVATSDFIQVKYHIRIQVSNIENEENGGPFYITSSWKMIEGSPKLIYQMCTRAIE